MDSRRTAIVVSVLHDQRVSLRLRFELLLTYYNFVGQADEEQAMCSILRRVKPTVHVNSQSQVWNARQERDTLMNEVMIRTDIPLENKWKAERTLQAMQTDPTQWGCLQKDLLDCMPDENNAVLVPGSGSESEESSDVTVINTSSSSVSDSDPE